LSKDAESLTCMVAFFVAVRLFILVLIL